VRLRSRYEDMPLSEFKKLVRDQFAMLLIGEKAALAFVSLAASGWCCDSQRKLQRYPGNRGGLRGDLDRGRGEVERDWPAVCNR